VRKLFFSDTPSELNSPLAHYWSNADIAGLSVNLLAPLSIASVQSRKGMAAELAKVLKRDHKLNLVDRSVCVGESDLVFIGTGPGAWLAFWPTDPAHPPSELADPLDGMASITDQSAAYYWRAALL